MIPVGDGPHVAELLRPCALIVLHRCPSALAGPSVGEVTWQDMSARPCGLVADLTPEVSVPPPPTFPRRVPAIGVARRDDADPPSAALYRQSCAPLRILPPATPQGGPHGSRSGGCSMRCFHARLSSPGPIPYGLAAVPKQSTVQAPAILTCMGKIQADSLSARGLARKARCDAHWALGDS